MVISLAALGRKFVTGHQTFWVIKGGRFRRWRLKARPRLVYGNKAALRVRPVQPQFFGDPVPIAARCVLLFPGASRRGRALLARENQIKTNLMGRPRGAPSLLAQPVRIFAADDGRLIQ